MSVDFLSERRVRYASRQHAGRALARELAPLVGRSDVIVLGLPPGGVPVASELAHALGAPLDLFIVRKLTVPGHDDVVMGAIASGGIRVLDRELIEALALPWSEVECAMRTQHAALQNHERQLRDGRRPLSLTHRSVVLVDDGVACGAPLHMGVEAVKTLRPAEVIAAVPVASISGRDDLCGADRVVCPLVPPDFRAISDWYDDYPPLSDADVRGWLGLPSSKTPVRA